MAPAMSMVAAHAPPRGLILLATGTGSAAALPLWGAIGCTALGAAFGGLVMFMVFFLKNCSSSAPSQCPKDCTCEKCAGTPLLPNSEKDCSSWQDGSPGCAAPAPKAVEAGMSWTVLITTLVMALPSVLGTWCWPLLLVALFPAASGSIESDSNREAFHHFTFGTDAVLFTAVIWYVASMASSARHMVSSFERWGPLVVVSLAAASLILDPIRHVLLDHGGVFFSERTLAMYSGQGQLSPMGRFCQTASITGIVLLVVGLLWHMRVPEAVLQKLGATENSKAL